ncbi:MAG: hypothetical protein IJJ33_11205 [Victivallales bacterium]|nr:hypothetical protein [Victivallales bacterium]
MTDLFSPEAVECFIHCTHEVYEKHLGNYFGSLVKGFFTDEPTICFSGERVPAGSLLALPYYDGLPEDYRQLTGGDLHSDIARALATGSNFYEGPCNQLFAKRFRNHYVDRIAAWCKQRNMVLTGHLMDENCAARGLLRNGHPLEVLGAFTLPGIDDIFTPCHAGQVEYLTLGSAMYAADRQKNGALAELFALGPCDMEFDRMIRQFWLCAAFGIDHYVMAVSPLTAQGNALKPNYYLPFTETQPWFPCFRELGQEAARAPRRLPGKGGGAPALPSATITRLNWSPIW